MARALGIDFGTANTYLSECPLDEVATTPVLLDESIGKATANLYRRHNGERELFLIGQLAINTFGTTPAAVREREGFELRTQYKPDIGRSRSARDYAEDFFGKLFEDQRGLGGPLAPSEVIFGIPGEADERFKGAVKIVALSTGFASERRPIKLFPEPFGALVYHLAGASPALPPALLSGAVLVVDFGGGTCDFTLMNGFSVERCWGEMLLGGRLFDDLFYQLFLEQNPEAHERIIANNDEHFIQFYECKQAKEEFSNLMQRARDRQHRFSRAIRPYGSLQIDGWEAFLTRAREYRPSPNMRARFEAAGEAAPGFDAEQPIDLLGWFEKGLRAGLDQSTAVGSRGGLGLAILTGGSSRWPFVAEIMNSVCASLSPEQARVTVSRNPYIDVGEGLAMIPGVARLGSRDIDRLNAYLQRDETGLSEVETIIRRVLRRVVDDCDAVADETLGAHFDGTLTPIVARFLEQGGRPRVLLRALSHSSEELQQALSRALEPLATRWSPAMQSALREALNEELRRELELPVSLARPPAVPLSFAGLFEGMGTGDFAASEAWRGRWLLVLRGAMVVAAALLLGLLRGLVPGAPELAFGLASGAALLGLGLTLLPRSRQRLVSGVGTVPLPAWMIGLLGFEEPLRLLLADARQALAKECRDRIEARLGEVHTSIALDLRRQLESEITARKTFCEQLARPAARVEGQ